MVTGFGVVVGLYRLLLPGILFTSRIIEVEASVGQGSPAFARFFPGEMS